MCDTVWQTIIYTNSNLQIQDLRFAYDTGFYALWLLYLFCVEYIFQIFWLFSVVIYVLETLFSY